MYNGIINIYKEAGFTSADVVAKMRGICGQRKIGHTGTLDPQATGVLPVCLGSGTKLCSLLTDRDKEYAAVLLLGVATDTQDAAGEILAEKPVEAGEEQVRETIMGFEGDYDQIPPMYSALKVNGRKLYEIAREGREVERRARPVKIHEIEIMEMRLPRVKMRVKCSKGTYIRTLCADIGERLGCGGIMESLVRTRVGEFTLERALKLAELEELRREGRIREALVPVDRMFAKDPALHMESGMDAALDNGNLIDADRTAEKKRYEDGRRVRFYRSDGSFAGLYAYDSGCGQYRPVKMFLERD